MKSIFALFLFFAGCSAVEQEAINRTLIDADIRLAAQNDQLRRMIEVETARLDRDVNRELRRREELRREAGLDPA